MENLYDSFATDKPTKIHHLLTASSVPRPVIGRLVPYQEDNLALMTSSLQELAASKRVLRQFSSLNCQLPSLEDQTKENDILWKGRSRDTTTASVTGKGKHFFYRRWDRPQSHRRLNQMERNACSPLPVSVTTWYFYKTLVFSFPAMLYLPHHYLHAKLKAQSKQNCLI